MGIKIKFLLFFLMMGEFASAQKNLVVYHVIGDIKIITNNKPEVAKRGNILTKNNSLQVKQNAGCMLIEQSGKSLQVNTAGTYPFEMLQNMMSKAEGNNVTSKFFSYVYQNLFSSKKSDQLSITPVVFRGEKLMMLPFDNAIIISDAVGLEWKHSAGSSTTHLLIRDNAGKIYLDTIIKSTTSLQINFSERNFLPGVYEWKSEEADTRQPQENYFHFLIAEKQDRRNILKDMKLLQDKTLSSEIKKQMQQDIFIKWKEYYSKAKE